MTDLGKIRLQDKKSGPETSTDPIEAFRNEIQKHGYKVNNIEPDGEIHRFDSIKRGDQAGWYALHLDSQICHGAFGDWRTGNKISWRSKTKDQVSPEVWEECERRIDEAERQQAEERARTQEQAKEKANNLWNEAETAHDNHPYLRAKSVPAIGIKQIDNVLLVPMMSANGTICSLQRIYPDGKKLNMKGGKKSGNFFIIPGNDEKIFICEGYATGCTIHAATGGTIFCTFDAWNMPAVSRLVRDKYPDTPIVVCADNDQYKPGIGNVGVKNAAKAARDINAKLFVPEFHDTTSEPSDCNDLEKLEGIDMVRSQIEQTELQQNNFCAEYYDDLNQDIIALNFVDKFGPDYRFDHSIGEWFYYNNVTWEKDETRIILDTIRKFIRQINIDNKAQLARVATALSVEKYVQADSKCRVTADYWDQDFYLLGTPAGTVDLRTGQLQQSRRSDAITKSTLVGPADNDTPKWHKFLLDSTGDDLHYVRFLQQVCGYCLTGSIKEHVLFFIYGPGGNGKSVFLNTILKILKDYARTSAMATFTASRSEQHPTDLAMLNGARLVTASETEEGRAWAESRIKSLTGGDPITARFMRQNFFTYQPQFKLLIIGNHQPSLSSVDAAMRRRFIILPFVNVPKEPDKDLEKKLEKEFSGIFRWMINGCLDWQRNGFVRPNVVTNATTSYFESQDLFGQWLTENCETGPNFSCPTKILYDDWKLFAEGQGENAGSMNPFSANLAKRNFERVRTRDTRQFKGLRIKVKKEWTDGYD